MQSLSGRRYQAEYLFSLALLWQIFTHAAARQIPIFGSVGIAVEAVEPRAREWRDVRRAELAGAVGR
jgi:hypothetical protein